MPSTYEVLSPNGHYTMAESIFAKLKAYMDAHGPGSKVDRAGDTMTGALNMDDTNITIKDLDINTDTDPSSDVWGKGYYLTCDDDVSVGYFRAIKGTDGKQGVQMETERYINGTRYFHNLNLRIGNDGTRYVELADPAAWRSALNCVNKAGDTMTGQLKTSFKQSVAMGSYEAEATTVDGLCAELRYSSGCSGSVSINTAYTKDGFTVQTGWYNFVWSPHRSGGVNGTASADNCNYGSLWLSGMTVSGCWMIRFANGAIAQIRDLYKSMGTWFANIGSGAANHMSALSSWFNSNKASIPRNTCLGVYSAAYGNGSIYTGYFLNGYDNAPYGGFFVAHYKNCYYVGIQNGTYSQYTLAHSGNVGEGDAQGQIKIAGQNVTVRGINTAAYSAASSFASSSHNHNSLYVRGTCKLKAGTVVRTVSAAATATVFTNAQLNSLLGVSNSSNANTVVYACNGDYGANNHRIYSVDYVPSGSRWDVRFGDNVSSGNYRYNYIVAYFG